jgi:CheY-like chemotaxis protein
MGVSRVESSPDVVAEPAQADLMFLDIRMPGKSGLDVMKELGQALPFPIIAMTGNVDKDSVDEYKCVECRELVFWSRLLRLSVGFCSRNRSVGFSGCLGKPFEKRDMKQMITAVLNKQWISVVSRS